MILITGGSGYLGGRIARHLLNSKEKKILIGTRKVSSEVPAPLIDCKFIQMSLDQPKELDFACNGVETIIHLAAMNAPDCQENPREAFVVNSQGTLNLLKAASNTGVRNFIYFSTAHIYGSPLTGLIDESTEPDPVHPYSVTHKRAEEHVLEFDSSGLLDGIVLRLSNVIGSPIDVNVNCWMLVANSFCKQAVIDRRIRISGNGKDMRDFIPISSVENLVEYLVSNPISQLNKKIMNVGSGVSMTILELSRLIEKRCKILFDYSPSIIIEERKEKKDESKLKYLCKVYEKLNIKKTKKLVNEIDDILLFCNTVFIS